MQNIDDAWESFLSNEYSVKDDNTSVDNNNKQQVY